jgi:chromosome segregation ATPase
MVKKGLLGAALTAGGLFLLFGTSAPSYVRTAFHKMRHNAKDAVPVQFEIERARQQIANLEPAIKDNIEILARAEVDVEHLDREIVATRDKLAAEKQAILAETDRLKKGDFRLAGHHVSVQADDLKADLAHRFDHYRNVSRILEEKERTLKAKQQQVVAARKQLENMAAQKRALLTKLEGIEAHLRMIEATKATNEFDFDDSALSRAKATVNDLERRLEVMERKSEMEGRFTETGTPGAVEEGRDVVKEIETEFNTPATTTETPAGDKHL